MRPSTRLDAIYCPHSAHQCIALVSLSPATPNFPLPRDITTPHHHRPGKGGGEGDTSSPIAPAAHKRTRRAFPSRILDSSCGDIPMWYLWAPLALTCTPLCSPHAPLRSCRMRPSAPQCAPARPASPPRAPACPRAPPHAPVRPRAPPRAPPRRDTRRHPLPFPPLPRERAHACPTAAPCAAHRCNVPPTAAPCAARRCCCNVPPTAAPCAARRCNVPVTAAPCAA